MPFADVDKLAKTGKPEDGYARNNEFWRTMWHVALQVAVPLWIVPPKVLGQGVPMTTDVVQAPVGMAARLVDELFWSPSCAPNFVAGRNTSFVSC